MPYAWNNINRKERLKGETLQQFKRRIKMMKKLHNRFLK